MPMHAAAAQAVYTSDQIIILSHSNLCFLFFLFLLCGSSVTLYMFCIFSSSCNKQWGKKANAKLALVFAGKLGEFRHISF